MKDHCAELCWYFNNSINNKLSARLVYTVPCQMLNQRRYGGIYRLSPDRNEDCVSYHPSRIEMNGGVGDEGPNDSTEKKTTSGQKH